MATPWRRARAAKATVGGGALVMGANEGAHDEGNGGEGPALATDARRDNNKNSNVQGDPAPALAYGMDNVARAAADDA